jgi:Lrp/AsnC family transcriptional regulator for asnA, asnC and gidA
MLDDIDREIISLLQYDGRLPFTQVASSLGITEGAVRRRVKRLIDQGTLQIVGIVEPEDLGWNEAAMIGITVQSNRIAEVANEIAKLPEVSYLFQAAGEFDFFAEVFCKDREHFVSFLNNRLQKIPGVERTQSFVILKMHKLSYRWGEAEPPDTHRPVPIDPDSISVTT